MSRTRLRLAVIAGGILLAGPPSSPAVAFDARDSGTALSTQQFFRPELAVTTSHLPAEARPRFSERREVAWGRLVELAGPDHRIYLDPRSGTPTNIMAAIPMIPGRGVLNTLTFEALARALGRPVSGIDSQLVAEVVTRFITDQGDALGVDPADLGPVRAAQVTPDLWHVRVPQEVNGVPVRHGHIVATLSHGNMVLFGTEMWGSVRIDTQARITADQALEIGFDHIGGRSSTDQLWQEPRLEIVPFAPTQYQSGRAFAGPVGEGYGHYLVWAFGFRRAGEIENWELLVDAHDGAILAFEDKNHYDRSQIKGGVYPLTSTEICPANATCGTMQPNQPMPYADTGLPPPNDFTNAAGVCESSGDPVWTTLNGKYVRMVDTCGPISESTSAGDLDLGGVNGQHDCTPGGTSSGDTPASRSGFYELNKLIETARGWLPSNPWLDTPITSYMNLNLTCNAYYYNGAIHFFQSGGGCRNTGELAAIFDHEWGHALDANDSGGVLSNSSEAYADIAAIYRLRASCLGPGFFQAVDHGCGMSPDASGFNFDESQTGTYCTANCSGVRDADWGAHVSGVPATPLGFVCTHCWSGSGPCGAQVHCAAAPSRQAAWDLVTRDLQAEPFNMSRDDAFNLGAKIFFQGSGNIGSWYACSCGVGADACGATNAYPQWLAADDDDGSLTNGTPHMTAIFAAFDRHGIACSAPVPANSGCAGGPTTAPVVTASIGTDQIGLSWSPVPGAMSYRILRAEGYAGCDFDKAVLAEVPGTAFTDDEVANDRPYYYVVQPVGESGACIGPGSPCLTVVPVPCSGVATPDASTYNCSDGIDVRLADLDLIGAGSETITVSSTAETTPEVVTLVESPSGSGVFTGTIHTTSAAAAQDGLISVTHGSTVTLTYLDASACGVPAVTVHRTAAVDCRRGSIAFGLDSYDCNDDLVLLTLLDSDLNLVPGIAETVKVPVTSSSETVPEMATLEEDPSNPGTFHGWIKTAPPPIVPGNGVVEAGHLDVLTATYQDADTGLGGSAIATVLASIGCAPPSISNIVVTPLSEDSAQVDWTTSHATDGYVEFGPTTEYGAIAYANGSGSKQHSAVVFPLVGCERTFFRVMAYDAFGWTAMADNGGAGFELYASTAAQACGGCIGAPSFGGLVSAFDIDGCAATGIQLGWEPPVAWGTGTTGTYSVYRDASPVFVPSNANRIASGVGTTSFTDDGAPTNTTLYYLVRAESDETCSSGPNNGGVTDANLLRGSARDDTSQPAPGAVGDTLGLSVTNHAHVHLTWTAVPGAAGYRVLRGSGAAGSFAPLADVGSTAFDDLNRATIGALDFYLVRAVDSCGHQEP